MIAWMWSNLSLHFLNLMARSLQGGALRGSLSSEGDSDDGKGCLGTMTKAKTRITLQEIDKVKKKTAEKGKSVYVWDDKLAGFGAYVSFSPPHNVSWLVQKWQGGRGGKAIRYAIGSTKDGIQLDEARKQAAIDIGRIAKGENIVAVRRERRRELNKEINSPGLLAAFETYVKKKSTGNQYWTDLERDVKKAIDLIGAKVPVIFVTKADIRKAIDNKTGQSAQRKLFAALRPFFDWCVQEDLITASPMACLTAPKPVASRDRLLTDDEVKAYWQASLSIPYPYGPFFRLCLLTGQRRNEVAGIRIDEIDMDEALWVIPAARSKNGKAHIVHLNPLALTVVKEALEALRERAKPLKDRPTNSYFIFTTTGDTPITSFSHAKAQLDNEMAGLLKEKLLPFVIHDLRRTLVSHLAGLGIATDVADRLLNHVNGGMQGVKAVYQRHEFLAERRHAMTVWGDHVSRIVNPG